MEDSKVAALARRIYQSHRAALDVIFEHRPDERLNLSEALQQRMKASASELSLRPMIFNKGFIRFLPREWDTSRNREGTAWGSTDSAFVLCEISVWSRFPVLRMIAAKAPDPWQSGLWNMSLNPPFKRTHKRTKPPGIWMSFYAVRNQKVSLDDVELGHEDEVAEKVWEWVKEELVSEDWVQSVKRVADHLPTL